MNECPSMKEHNIAEVVVTDVHQSSSPLPQRFILYDEQVRTGRACAGGDHCMIGASRYKEMRYDSS